jgi:hypothetical protein
MSGFDASWLDLRENADAAARDRSLVERLSSRIPTGAQQQQLRQRSATPERALAITDLGGGTGANLRFLAPLIGGNQAWRVIDHDPALLSALSVRVESWSQQHGFSPSNANRGGGGSASSGGIGAVSGGNAVALAGDSFSASIETVEMDLNLQLSALAIPVGGLLTASALLDLVSETWLRSLVQQLADSAAAAYFALSYDGRVALRPALATDDEVITLVNAHQRGDKGFGPALGPMASATARELLQVVDYVVESATSNWHLNAQHAPLQRELINGWVAAAIEMQPDSRARFEEWGAIRHAQANAAALEIMVGHQDIAAWPAK